VALASAHPLTRGTFRTTLSGVGRLGPIEERLGRRLIRIVSPDSKEGHHLLRSGCVTFLGPEGEALGCADLEAARRLLRRRLQDRLGRVAGAENAEIVRDGLARLRHGDARLGRG
jgi:hypothetical protein